MPLYRQFVARLVPFVVQVCHIKQCLNPYPLLLGQLVCSSQAESPTPSLGTPRVSLLQSGPAAVSSSQSLQTPHDDVEVWKIWAGCFKWWGLQSRSVRNVLEMVAKLQIQITKGNRLGCYPFFCDIADLESEEQVQV
ncbi:hypothetical protein Acr_04g0006840 [Actinidia rufa]|uniref:Uncharacterized protein n=1 Tax=Actinidia rufa TaxID=165716 RepID=A0A7J0EIC4_9ERIC|nr:hypothetical protein Acr_04g0006840 [Actinidia rufa]